MTIDDLKTLIALLETEHVGRTARRLGVSQPAVSQALKRLRATFEDDILVRTKHQMVATQQMIARLPELRRALAEFETAVRPVSDPDLQNFSGEFKIAIDGNLAFQFLARFVREARPMWPHARFAIQGVDDMCFDKLIRSELDVVMTRVRSVSSELHEHKLYPETTVLLVDRRHPFVGNVPDLQEYLAANHLVVGTEHPIKSQIDELLANKGLGRRVALRLPDFRQVADLLVGTELVFSAPASLAKCLTTHNKNLRIQQCPVDVPTYWYGIYASRNGLRNHKTAALMNKLIAFFDEEFGGN